MVGSSVGDTAGASVGSSAGARVGVADGVVIGAGVAIGTVTGAAAGTGTDVGCAVASCSPATRLRQHLLRERTMAFVASSSEIEEYAGITA